MNIEPIINISPENLKGYINEFEIDYNTPENMLLGTFISRTLELKLAGIDGEIPAEILIEIGVNEETPTKMPNFIVTECTKNEDSEEVTIKGFDYSIKFDEYFDLELEYPLTLKQLMQAISARIGVEVENIDFSNNDFVMQKAKIDNKFTYREIVGMIASAMGGIAFINNNNKVEFKLMTETNFEIDNVFEEVINTEKIGPVNSVVLAREPVVDNIQLKDEESIVEYGKTEMKIVNNWLLDDDRESAITNIYNNLLNKEFYCANIATYQGYLINPLDVVIVNDKKVLINNINIKYPLLLDGYVGSEQLTKTEVKYNTAKGLEKRIVNAEAEVDKINGEINLIVSEQTAQSEKITNINTNINSINSSVKMIGGNNKQRNSVGAYGTEDFEQNDTGDNNDIIATEETALKTITDNGFGRIIYIANNKWFKFKSESLVKGETYTLSFKYSNVLNNHCQIIFHNNSNVNFVDTYEEKELENFEYTFVANTEFVELEVITGDYVVGITDYYLQTGDIATKWQPAAGEALSTVLSIYYNGIEVTSENSEIITRISNLGFSVISSTNTDKILITFDKDRCILSDTEINGILDQSNWLRYVQKINNKEILLEVKI